ncbi:MAG: hypothetical protein SFW08_07345 [Gemmatimonadaceae bacterium]|nr:hypothetical protein [Gemmatimonadaceae bacterium]
MTAFERLGTPTIAKLVVAAAGLVLFGAGVRTESMRLRWWGIAVVGIAAALRFWRTPRAPTVTADETER